MTDQPITDKLNELLMAVVREGREPLAVRIGRQEFYGLAKEQAASHWRLAPTPDGRATYDGLRVERADELSHLSVIATPAPTSWARARYD